MPPEEVAMRKARFTEHQIITVLKSGEAGRTVKNSFIERFNRTYRTELLDFYLLRTRNEAREITERWLKEYNS